MVFSYVKQLPKRWRLFILSLCFILLMVQMWVLTGSSSKLPLDEVNLSPQSEETIDKSRVGTPIKEPSTPPAPKQNVLLGFGGFLSNLPQIQHNFGPEPLAYTRLRERRREAVKKSFLHGWKGYSKLIKPPTPIYIY